MPVSATSAENGQSEVSLAQDGVYITDDNFSTLFER